MLQFKNLEIFFTILPLLMHISPWHTHIHLDVSFEIGQHIWLAWYISLLGFKWCSYFTLVLLIAKIPILWMSLHTYDIDGDVLSLFVYDICYVKTLW